MMLKNELNKIAFVNARLIDPESGLDTLGQIFIENKLIKKININKNNFTVPKNFKIIDCKNMVLCPGFIDICAHLREPGEEYKENIESASKSAISGGITSLVCMPNTKPAIDQISVIEFVARRARETSGVKIYPAATITKDLKGKILTEMGLLQEAGAILFTEGNKTLSNSKMMKQALEYAKNFDALIVQQPQDFDLSENGVMNAGQLATKLGLPGIPKIAEIIQVERDIRILENTGGRLHFLNITTKESLEIISKARMDGLRVSCSTSPQYFVLNENAVDQWKTFAKLMPPLRSDNDRNYIFNSINNINIITSHHSPQDQDSKRVPFEMAEFGIIGMETLLPLCLKLYFEGKMKLIDVLDKITYQPAKLLNLKSGRLKINAPADICIFDPDYSYKIRVDKMRSKSKNSLFDGYEVKGKVIATIIDGKIMYKTSKIKI